MAGAVVGGSGCDECWQSRGGSIGKALCELDDKSVDGHPATLRFSSEFRFSLGRKVNGHWTSLHREADRLSFTILAMPWCC